MKKALGHIRVLDLTRVLAGPWATQNQGYARAVRGQRAGDYQPDGQEHRHHVRRSAFVDAVIGAQPMPGSAEASGQFVRDERSRWIPLAKTLGVKAD